MCLLGDHIIIVEKEGRYAVEFVDISSEVNAVTIFGAEDIANIVYVADEDDFVEAIAVLILNNRPMRREVIGCLCREEIEQSENMLWVYSVEVIYNKNLLLVNRGINHLD